AAAGGAHGQSHGNLLLPADGTGEQQVGEIGTSDDQNQAHRHQDDGADSQYRTTPFRVIHEGGTIDQNGGLAAGRGGIEPCGNHCQVGAGGSQSGAGLEAARHLEPAQIGIGEELAFLDPLLLQGEWSPDISPKHARAAKAFGSYSDNSVTSP